MEVKINREIRNYTESMFFGLSMRQFVFSVLACGVAVGLYFYSAHVGTETVSWMCVLGAVPFAALGFIRYHGMNAEQFFVGVDQIGVPYPETPAVQPGEHLLRSGEAVH